MKGKEPDHYVVSHCNIGVTEDFFNTSLSSWGDAWILDTSTTSYMKFQRYLFKDFNENVDGIVYFSYKSSIKPSRMGTIRLKLPGLSDFLLHNVVYLLELQRRLLSLVYIRNKDHCVHMIS
jgi:hypothetical protein